MPADEVLLPSLLTWQFSPFSPFSPSALESTCPFSKADLVHTTNRSDCRHGLRWSVRHDLGLAENRIGLAENRRRRRKTRKNKKIKNKCLSSGLLIRRVKNPLVIGYQNAFLRIGNSFLILFWFKSLNNLKTHIKKPL